jgi:hypothetical protein
MGITDATISTIGVYPNPATTTLYITIDKSQWKTDAQNLAFDIIIFDMAGRRVEIKPVVSLQNGMASLNVSHLSAGVYILKIGNYRSKFVKQ